MSNVKAIKAKDIALLFICVWCISPPLFINGLARLLALACMLFCIVNKFYKRDVFVFGAIFMLFTILIGGWNNPNHILADIQLYIMVALAFLADNYFDGKEPASKFNIDFISKVINLVYPIWMITTISAYGTIPNISRMLVNNTNINVEEWYLKGVGGYGMIYSLVFYNIILLFELVNGQKDRTKKRTGIVLVNYILSLVTVIMAGYSIAFIATLFGTLLVLLVKGKKMKNIMGVVLIVVLIVVLWSFVKDYVVDFFVNISKGTMYEFKVRDIIESLTDQEATGTVKARTDLYAYSWEGFLASPIFGTIATTRPQFGGHSLLLDTFAKFGIIGGVALVYIVFYLPAINMKKDSAFTVSFALLVCMLFVMGTNNVSAAMAPIVFLYYPYVVNRLESAPQLQPEAK